MNPNHPPTLHAIVAAVEAEFELKPRTLYRRSKQQQICHPRQVAWWIMREATPASFPEIGQMFHVHHTTVFHGVEKIERGLVGDADLLAIVQRIQGVILQINALNHVK